MRHATRLLIPLASALLASAPAVAQVYRNPRAAETETTRPEPDPAPRTTVFAPVPLSDEPVVIDALGLALSVPLNAVVHATFIGSEAATRIELPDQAGVISVQRKQTSNLELELGEIGDGIVADFERRFGKIGAGGRVASTLAEVLERVRLNVDAKPADRIYIAHPRQSGGPDSVRGYTIFQREPGEYVIFELLTTLDKLDRARPMYETSIGTASFKEMADVNARRGMAIRAGVAVFEQLEPEDYKAVFDGTERWHRLYTPARTGVDADAKEHGYRRVRAWIGQRGEIDRDKPKTRWNAADEEMGYLVSVESRQLVNNLVWDVIATYFMSADRGQEAWSIGMTIRAGDQRERYSEIGGRAGDRLSILVKNPSDGDRVVHPLIQGDGYVNQVESLMLAPLLIRAGIGADFAFYAYQSKFETIKLRSESVERPDSAGGLWTITTRLNEDAPPQVATYHADGTLDAIRMPGGRVWEPIELERLFRLWKQKQLPLD